MPAPLNNSDLFENVTALMTNQFSLRDPDFDIREVDVFVNQDRSLPLPMLWGAILGVVPVNLLVLFWLKNKTQTLIDWMMFLDCISNIGSLTLLMTVINVP